MFAGGGGVGLLGHTVYQMCGLLKEIKMRKIQSTFFCQRKDETICSKLFFVVGVEAMAH